MKTAKELLDHRSMMIAVKKGVVTREAFRNALREQRRQYAKSRTYFPLSRILVERGDLAESQLDMISAPSFGAGGSRMTDGSAEKMVNGEDRVACPLPEENDGDQQTSELDCQAELSQKGLSLIITKDGLMAYISAQGSESDAPTLKDVHRLLDNRKIVFGIIEDQVIQRLLDEAISEKSSFLVAAGIEPEIGVPDRVTYHFDTNPFRVGTVNEDGLMDWKERGDYPFVEKDTILATIIPGQKSVPGKDIFGHQLVAEEMPRLHLFAGKGVVKSKDRLQLIAKVSGQPQLTGRGNVSVIQTLSIKGDIGIETGHVTFEGHVEVKGAVEKGYRVKGDSLRAKEILSELVDIVGDVVSMRGVFGARIRAGGRFKANHVNKSTIIADGDIAIAKEIVDCRIITNGKCILEGCTVLSSQIYAKKGIKVASVGSEAAHPSKLVVGVDQIAKLKVSDLKAEIEECKQKIADLEQELPALKEESDRLNTELGEIAQVQDKFMVDRRKITDILEKEQRSATAEEQTVLSDLNTKIVEIDRVVEELMGKDEKNQEEVTERRNEIHACNQRIDELNEEIKETELFAKRDIGIPVLQVFGKLYQNTQVEGPHDSLKIEKTMHNATIKEQKNTDKNAENPYSFKVSHR